ncbi:MAG: pseudouridine-5'-phosphate glycosidase [Phycisphaerales bacterium]|jgi:pseudouridine-5'-phosphate glycosidase|nr:pseudouridine-5'-phosphate glycosidase [Phycisphaerales bacterium]
MTSTIQVHDTVSSALAAGRSVVLLETAVLTCGLPRLPWSIDHGPCPPSIDANESLNLSCMRAMIAAVEAVGCVPAVTALVRGVPRVGLSDEELGELALDETAGKASTASLAQSMATRASAGTTVSATLRLGGSAAYPDRRRPRVFATGGIGGVHVGWTRHLDVSADLSELAAQQICVVCAGAKSIIDSTATTELLESLGVPVLGLGIDRMPGFQCGPSNDAPSITRVDSIPAAAAICASQWSIPSSGGLLLTQPPPREFEMSREVIDAAACQAEDSVDCTGSARTPALLEAMACLTGGATLRTNVELLVANAATAAMLALAIDS